MYFANTGAESKHGLRVNFSSPWLCSRRNLRTVAIAHKVYTTFKDIPNDGANTRTVHKDMRSTDLHSCCTTSSQDPMKPYQHHITIGLKDATVLAMLLDGWMVSQQTYSEELGMHLFTCTLQVGVMRTLQGLYKARPSMMRSLFAFDNGEGIYIVR